MASPLANAIYLEIYYLHKLNFQLQRMESMDSIYYNTLAKITKYIIYNIDIGKI